MDPQALLYARAQMEVSLGFHMVFAALGIAMPVLLLLSEGLYLRTGRPHYLALAKRWTWATALLFAVGAVSGTALSFELGLLWPRLMARAGATLGPAFALEGYAFFIEAIFIGMYLYGWQRLSPRMHFLSGIPVALSGLLSGVLVVAANAWMQCPDLAASGGACGMDAPSQSPWAVFRSPLWMVMALHSSLSCYIAVGFAVAGIYAWNLLRPRSATWAKDPEHRRYLLSGLRLSLALGSIAAALQIPSGDLCAKALHKYQPVKLAAAESLFVTTKEAPLLIGGIPDVESKTVSMGLHVPKALSFLSTGTWDAEIQGLDKVPQALWPHVLLTHFSFQVMVAAGFALLLLGLAWGVALFKKRDEHPLLLWALVVGSPLGFVALEAGWIVTEVGRQPWVLYGAMLTREAVTPVPSIPLSFYVFALLYLGLGIALFTILRWLSRSDPLTSGGHS